jgi:N-acyl-D-amino-acid deacylase
MFEALARLEAAQAAGLDAAFDIYLRGLRHGTHDHPLWSRDGGTTQFLARLGTDSLLTRLRTETEAKVALIGGWDNVLVSDAPAGRSSAVGKRRESIRATAMPIPTRRPSRCFRVRARPNGRVRHERGKRRAGLAHPLASVCSDGGAVAVDSPTRRGRPHPKLGTFPGCWGAMCAKALRLGMHCTR